MSVDAAAAEEPRELPPLAAAAMADETAAVAVSERSEAGGSRS